jgi:Tfp pilus assembly protein PilE
LIQPNAFRHGHARTGYWLIEFSVVFLLTSVAAVYSIPRLLQSVERGKAAGSFRYLDSVRVSQERFRTRRGTYASDLTELGMRAGGPTSFRIGTLTAGASGRLLDSWSLTLTRSAARSRFGGYTVTFTQDGFDSANSTIDAEIDPR